MRPNVLKWLIVGLCVTALCIGGASAWWWDVNNYTDKNNGDTVNVQTDTYFTLTLPENPSSGYLWDIRTSNGIEMNDRGYVADEKYKGLDGSGGVHSWGFVALERGKQQITGVSTRPWNSKDPYSTTYTLNLNVYKNFPG